MDSPHGTLSYLFLSSVLYILNLMTSNRSSTSTVLCSPSLSHPREIDHLQPANMPFPQRPSATAILALLLHSANFVSSQTMISPNYASESPSIYQEYNFTYPTYATDQTVLTSYKDTIDVSWTSIAPHHPPSLSIECWIRNATTSPICTYNFVTPCFQSPC